ncbi:MAG: hypothetical protein ACFFB3_10305 [Candidatus Hodarchaeota archaeon]
MHHAGHQLRAVDRRSVCAFPAGKTPSDPFVLEDRDRGASGSAEERWVRGKSTA